jgi:hypothetical protein
MHSTNEYHMNSPPIDVPQVLFNLFSKIMRLETQLIALTEQLRDLQRQQQQQQAQQEQQQQENQAQQQLQQQQQQQEDPWRWY